MVWKPSYLAEAASLLVTVIVLSQIVFGVPFQSLRQPDYFVAYLMTAPVIWAAFRFGLRGVTSTLLLVSVAVLWGTVQRRGPFVGESIGESLLLMQVFTGVVAMIGLILAAAQTQARQAIGS